MWQMVHFSAVTFLTLHQPHDIFSPDIRAGLMFDELFKNSEQYFIVLQLLRIFDETVRKASQSIKDLWGWLSTPLPQ